ncbi:hypothetical protein PVAG01_01256 [Phlyctema vagabunda]|uniref:Chitin-binding type-1 domain-containing protein n=1 Tax=Phlyctema vagabunda TaxID=108571 RepID=A0ABR4PX70_9HELO
MKAFATLVWLLPAMAVAQLGTGVETPDGSCGVDAGFTCTPTWGSCCGKDNLCGRSSAYCGTGCQPLFGNCNVPVPTATPVPTGPGSTSPDGSCAGTSQYNCTGSSYGSCCSSSNFCGSSPGHCEAGCQAAFGTCVTGTGDISIDGSCGANGKTCKGSSFGACCSSSGFCGDSTSFCAAGCQ